MKKYLLFFALLYLAACQIDKESPALNLSEDWHFRKANTKDWRKATIPGSVHADLLANKMIEDPFFRDNEGAAQWVEKEDWEYLKQFDLTEEQLAQGNMDLVFHGLDTYADVYLNDTLILSADNMFRSWRVDVKALLKERNDLRIYFHSATNKEDSILKTMPYKLPGGSRVLTRKAGFHYGWDWGPRLVTAGIWKPIELDMWDKARITHMRVEQKRLADKVAELKAIVEVESLVDATATLDFQYNNKEVGSTVSITSETVNLKKGMNTLEIEGDISDPRLWWTHDLGEQFLYNLVTEITVDNRKIKAEKRIGLRTIEVVTDMDADSSGRKFYFKLNGEPIFAKGANYIPQDNLQSRVTDEKYKKIIQEVKDINMNMLRVWGGGIYENDIFYDLCDEQGILVWQDFMFACAMYPIDSVFRQNVEQEAIENVRRLNHHPSIALWCGNNENSEGWHRWGWQNQFNEQEKIEVWQGYERIFKELLPEVVSKETDNVFYWETSPKFGRGNPQHQFEGDAHYWGVWHDAESFDTFNVKVPRFMSEYGFQSYPSMETIKEFTSPEDWEADSEVMKVHQKHSRGNKLIQDYMERWYNKPKTFMDFLYLSQVLQAEGIRTGIEAHRRAKPYCWGTLYWQLNDCWPSVSWSSRDYYGRWKALQYTAKKAYNPYLISFVENDSSIIEVHVVSDKLEVTKGEMIYKVMDFSGKVLDDGQLSVEIAPNSSSIQIEFPISKSWSRTETVIAVSFSQEGKVLTTNNFYLSLPKFLSLPKTEIKETITKKGEGYVIRLESDKLAKHVYLRSEVKGFFSDNYMDILPNEPIEIVFTPDDTTVEWDEKIRVMSLLDSY